MERHRSIDNNDQSKWVFGTERRKIAKGSFSPGPGAYPVASQAFNFTKPRFFMGEKIAYSPTTPSLKTPTSWAYNPKLDLTKT